MRWRLFAAVAALGIFLSGCAIKPQQPVPLGKDALTSSSAKSAKVGVAMSELPKVDTFFPGADCLLCYAFASASNSALTKHTETLARDDLASLKEDVAAALRKKNVEVMVIKEAIDLKSLPDIRTEVPTAARKDFASLRVKHAVDKLLVIDMPQVGYVRTYASYVPTSDPKAVVTGAAYLVDLKTNTYSWYLPININRAAGTTWDEPPKFPGLTNAYFQAIEASRDSVLKPLADVAVPEGAPATGAQ
ncbi:hypothetical protein [Variovorax sp.]|jgi:hypothetical protein|uniref:hypothetical protein n=1 Tax=Variovorax sp. TaxID=1871043 RepID=UPI0037DA068D